MLPKPHSGNIKNSNGDGRTPKNMNMFGHLLDKDRTFQLILPLHKYPWIASDMNEEGGVYVAQMVSLHPAVLQSPVVTCPLSKEIYVYLSVQHQQSLC